MSEIKFLLDENIGVKTAEFLRKQNFNTKTALEDLKGFPDKKILEIANKENRIIITLDKDFCDLIFRDSLPCKGLILLRLKNEFPESIIDILEKTLKTTSEFYNKLIVVRENKIRIKKLNHEKLIFKKIN